MPGRPGGTSPQLRRLLDQLPEAAALVLGSGMDILAWNRLAAALITDFSRIPEEQRNYVRMVFTDPAMRTLYPDWADVAHKAVTNLHMDAARHPDDPRLAELVRELSTLDADFRNWWHGHHVTSKGQGTKRFHHPVVGEITLDWDTLDLRHGTGSAGDRADRAAGHAVARRPAHPGVLGRRARGGRSGCRSRAVDARIGSFSPGPSAVPRPAARPNPGSGR